MDIIHQTAKHCERPLFSLLSTDDEKTGIASTIIIEEIGYAFVCNWNIKEGTNFIHNKIVISTN